MKILLTTDPEIPVPPVLYGGIERIVSSLAEGYTRKGHQVFLVANPESTETNIVQKFGWKGLKSQKKTDIITNARQLLKITQQIKPNIIHSFSRLLYLYPVFLRTKIPVVQSYQRKINPYSTRLASFFAGKKLYFTACGEHMYLTLKNKDHFIAIHNFTDTTYYSCLEPISRDYLFFLGRIEDIKGTHEAIEVAKRTQQKLIIAGNIPQEHQSYFDKQVKPHLSETIKYVGRVNDKQKRHYLQHAKAMLFPIKWEEPFGIVMAESMACGTPVVAFNRGAVNEVIENGLNGYKVNTIDEMVQAIKKLPEINYFNVQKNAQKRFDKEVITNKYLKLFLELSKIN